MGISILGRKEIALVFATALAVTCGGASLGLEVLRTVDGRVIVKVQELIDKNLVGVNLETENGKGACITKGSHIMLYI